MVVELLGAAGMACLGSMVFAPSRRGKVGKVGQLVVVAGLLAAFAVSSQSFVGPPRDRQPSLWETPAKQSQKTQTNGQPVDEKLSKRVRAVAIGSAAGILLSLVAQTVLRDPADELVPTPRVQVAPARRQSQSSQSSQNSRSSQGSQSGFSRREANPPSGPDLNWVGTLSTGVVIGLAVGFSVGVKQPTPKVEASKAKNSSKDLSNHALKEEVSELQNSQPVK